MNKSEFLKTLEVALIDFRDDEKKDILYDYEEHFRIGEEKGKSESELISELGNPEDIAEQYRTSSSSEINNSDTNYRTVNDETTSNNMYAGYNETSKSVGASILAILALILFNVIIFLAPYLAAAGVIVALFAGSIAIALGGVAATFSVVIAPLIPNYVNAPNLIGSVGVFFIGIGTVAFGALLVIAVCYIIKYFCKFTVRYAKWNIKVIRG